MTSLQQDLDQLVKVLGIAALITGVGVLGLTLRDHVHDLPTIVRVASHPVPVGSTAQSSVFRAMVRNLH